MFALALCVQCRMEAPGGSQGCPWAGLCSPAPTCRLPPFSLLRPQFRSPQLPIWRLHLQRACCRRSGAVRLTSLVSFSQGSLFSLASCLRPDNSCFVSFIHAFSCLWKKGLFGNSCSSLANHGNLSFKPKNKHFSGSALRLGWRG